MRGSSTCRHKTFSPIPQGSFLPLPSPTGTRTLKNSCGEGDRVLASAHTGSSTSYEKSNCVVSVTTTTGLKHSGPNASAFPSAGLAAALVPSDASPKFQLIWRLAGSKYHEHRLSPPVSLSCFGDRVTSVTR